MRAILRISFGIALVLVGIVGLILPIMPGWIFLIPGLVILGDYFPPIRRLLDWANAKFEGARSAMKPDQNRSSDVPPASPVGKHD